MDIINALFELIGGVVVWRNVYALWQDKYIAGIHWSSVAFFALWGLWNIIFYPSLGQFWSTLGAVFMWLGNLAWISLAYYYHNVREIDG